MTYACADVLSTALSAPMTLSAPARPRCEVPTTCHPASACGKEGSWPALIRTITAADLELTVCRRFERGSGLAIALPAGDGSRSIVLARVTEVETLGATGWRLACAFISELSQEEVEGVLHLDPDYRASLATNTGSFHDGHPRAVTRVLFQVRLGP